MRTYTVTVPVTITVEVDQGYTIPESYDEHMKYEALHIHKEVSDAFSSEIEGDFFVGEPVIERKG